MRDFTLAIEKLSIDLRNSGYYKPETTLKIVKNARKAEGPDEYNYALIKLVEKLKEGIKVTVSLSPLKRDDYFNKNNLRLTNVLQEIRQKYQDHFDNKEWGQLVQAEITKRQHTVLLRANFQQSTSSHLWDLIPRSRSSAFIVEDHI